MLSFSLIELIAGTMLLVLAFFALTSFVRITAAFIVVALIAFSLPVAAADGDLQLFSIDISPIMDLVLQLLGVALLGLGTWAINWITQKFKLSADSEVRKTLQDALANGVAYATNKLHAEGLKVSTIETRYKIVAEAANYVSKRTPDALAYFKISPESLHDLITARLPTPITGDATPPAT